MSLTKYQQIKSDQILSEQYAAQIASLSCSISLNAIKQGSSNYKRYGYKRSKTKYEYNKERVRDMVHQRERYPKPSITTITSKEEEDSKDNVEYTGHVSYNVFKTDPVPFVRNYQYLETNETLRKVQFNSMFSQNIDKIDINNLLIGHNQFELLCKGLRRSSVKLLNISGNNLTNCSLKSLSMILRSMHNLIELSIARNKITDDGIKYLFHEDCYSSTLKKIDISCNALGPASAYYIVSLFNKDKVKINLTSLFLGGKVGTKGWGDEFIRVLVCGIITGSRLSKIKELHIADAQLTKFGFHILTALLVCDKVGLEVLNISRNASQNTRTRMDFMNAVRMNYTLTTLFIRECGFSTREMEICRNAIERNHNMTSSYYYNRQQRIELLSSLEDSSSSSIMSNSISLIENHMNNMSLEHNKLEESTVISEKMSLYLNKPNSYSSSRNRNNIPHSEENSYIRVDNHNEYYYEKSTFSWLELSSLSECVAGAFNMSRHSYHKVKVSFILDYPWRIPRPPKWQPVSPPPSMEYSPGYDMMSVITNKFDSAPVMLPSILKQDMLMINTELKYVALLEEAKRICAITTMDPRTIGGVIKQLNAAAINEFIDELYLAVKSSEISLENHIVLCNKAKSSFLDEIELFMINAEEQVKLIKRKDRRHISSIHTEVSAILNNDAIMMCVEDYRAALVEKCVCFEKLIGGLYMQKLLYFCIFEGQTSKITEVFSIANSMRRSLPYYDNLGLSASFAHYFYIAFAKEREDDHMQVNEKMLQKLASKDHTFINTNIMNHEIDQSISKQEIQQEEDADDQLEEVKPYTKEDRKKEKRTPIFLCKRTELAGKTDASIKADKAAKVKALRNAMKIAENNKDDDDAIDMDSKEIEISLIENVNNFDEISHNSLPPIIEYNSNSILIMTNSFNTDIDIKLESQMLSSTSFLPRI